MIVARKLLYEIDARIEQDNGARYRQHLGEVLPHISDAYRDTNDDGLRGHLGASGLGADCARAIWYNFHWYSKSRFPGRMLRLFNRGHLEEGRFIAMLLTCDVGVYQQDENGNQFRVKFASGHGGGSGDGVLVNVPDAPDTTLLAEFKTSNNKGFSSVSSTGVREAKFQHYVQMNIYMYLMRLPAALYMMVNKNTDELHAEIVPVDNLVAEQYIERAQKIIDMRKAPKRISETGSYWKCKFCDFNAVCHRNEEPLHNCRTCKHGIPGPDGVWNCALTSKLLSKVEQLAGCENWSAHDAT